MEVDIHYKIRAILGKKQFNASLHCCTGIEQKPAANAVDVDLKRTLIVQVICAYTSIYQTLELTPNIIITDMLHGYQRHYCTGDQ